VDSKYAHYKELLLELHQHLVGVSEKKWAERLQEWIKELDGADKDGVINHLKRTQKALGGMGSIGDIVICPENGHSIPSDEDQINRANERLKGLVSNLFSEIERLV
jgi:hypothetical protein